MKKAKVRSNTWTKKIEGKNNYQFRGFIKTPWGIFESGTAAINEAKILRKCGIDVITDGNTLRLYLANINKPLNLKGRRIPKAWRGKSPKELGFGIIKEK